LSTHKNLITHLSQLQSKLPTKQTPPSSHTPPPPKTKKTDYAISLGITHSPSPSLTYLQTNKQLVVPFPPSNVSHSTSPHLQLRFLSYKPTTFHKKIYVRGVALTQSLLSNCHSKAFMILRGANVPRSLTSVGVLYKPMVLAKPSEAWLCFCKRKTHEPVLGKHRGIYHDGQWLVQTRLKSLKWGL
jgi:hypothetical protein